MHSTTATIQTPTIEHDGRTHRMFFVRGRMRSGTNWICNLLNLHPQINCHGEFHFEKLLEGFERFVEGAEGGIGSDVAAVGRACYQDAVKQCMSVRIGHKPGAGWVGDRSPSRIDDWFPGVPVIHTIRDGRDAAVSWALHRAGMDRVLQNPEQEAWRQEFIADPLLFDRKPTMLVEHESYMRVGIRNWRDQVQADLDIFKKIERGDLDIPLFSLRYEDLHTDAEGLRRGMYEFLDLDPDEALPLSPKSGTVPGVSKYKGNGKAQVGSWREFFTDEAKQWFKEDAGELLIELGYESDMSW